MAQAIRTFIAGMDFPSEQDTKPSGSVGLKLSVPESDNTVESNLPYAAVILALLTFAKDLRLDSTEVTVDPSMAQLAEICHCSGRTIRRTLEKLQKHGMVFRTIRRGHSSNVYKIVRQVRQDRGDRSPEKDRQDRGDHSESKRDWTPTTKRLDTHYKETGHTSSVSGVKPLGVKPLDNTSENVLSCSASGTTHDGSSTHAKGSPEDNSSGDCFYCPRCNEANTVLNDDHTCTQCLRLMEGGLKRPRTPEQGRLHMIQVLTPMGEGERQALYRSDLTVAEELWIKNCGMIFAEEMKEAEADDKRAELLERCGVSEDEAL